jgi:hypothetical protein
MTHSWQQSDWTKLTFDITAIFDELTLFERHFGRPSGVLDALAEDTQGGTLIDVMVSEAIKTSDTKGAYLCIADGGRPAVCTASHVDAREQSDPGRHLAHRQGSHAGRVGRYLTGPTPSGSHAHFRYSGHVGTVHRLVQHNRPRLRHSNQASPGLHWRICIWKA